MNEVWIVEEVIYPDAPGRRVIAAYATQEEAETRAKTCYYGGYARAIPFGA